MESLTTGATDSVTTIYQGSQISEVVVRTVAQAKGVDPLELEPLYGVVDPDALDSIFSSKDTSSDTKLGFTMAGCEVVVRGDGEVSVTPPASTESSITVTHLDD